MADSFTGEIRMFAGNFAPQNWLFCMGQEVSINNYNTLFSIIGNIYGIPSNPSAFKLPNLQGNVPMHQGAGANPALTPRGIGSTTGTEKVTLTSPAMPAHTHTPQGQNLVGNVNSPNNSLWSQSPKSGRTQTQTNLYAPPSSTVPMDYNMVGFSGGNESHNNMQPFLALNFIICCNGEYPVRP